MNNEYFGCVCGCRVDVEGKSIFFFSLVVLVDTGFKIISLTSLQSIIQVDIKLGNHTKASLTKTLCIHL